MEMIYIQFVVDLGGETYILLQVVRACWRDGSGEQMSVVGLEAVLKERLRTLRTFQTLRFLNQIIFPTLHNHLITI